VGNIKLVSGRGKKGRRKTTADKKTGTAADTNKLTGKRADAKKKAGSGVRTAFTIILIFLVGVAALVISLGIYVNRLDIVFPNVWADGISLSGLTLEESTRMLIDMGYESNAENASATVVFPDDSSFTITGEQAGFALDASEAALAAYEFGREGTFFENEIAYVRALFRRTDLRDLSVSKFDKEFVRAIAADYTMRFNDVIVNNAYTIESTRIVVTKGTGVEPADEDSVFDLAVSTLLKAMDMQSHLTVSYTPDKTEVKEVDLGLLYSIIRVDAVDSVYDPNTFSATKSSTGLTFDMDKAQAMLDSAGSGIDVVIPLIIVEPEVAKEDIDSMLFRDVLAERTTRILGTSNRLNNIVLSSQAVNETLLNPGDEFSFNNIVGQRTAAKGYREAGAYVGGMTVLEIGGGICQTSSTIYDCVLHADLTVTERWEHRFTVAYLPLGSDATINWGSLDFRFINSTKYPIRVEAVVTGRDLEVKLIGTKLDDTYIKVDFEKISETPFQVVRREDESIPQGETKTYTDGHTGYVVDTYKYLYDGDDNLISKTRVGRSTYRVQDKIILIPPELPPEETGNPGETGSPSPDPSPTDPSPTGPSPTDPSPTDPSPSTDPPSSPDPSSPTDPSPSTDPPTEPTADPDPGSPEEGTRQDPDT